MIRYVLFGILIVFVGCKNNEPDRSNSVDIFNELDNDIGNDIEVNVGNEVKNEIDNDKESRKCSEFGSLVSIFNLLGNPDKYVNKRVILVGYLSFKPEDISIYPSKEMYDAHLLGNKILISVDKTKTKLDLFCDIKPLAEKYVWVKGIFRKFTESIIVKNSSSSESTIPECDINIMDYYVLVIEEIERWGGWGEQVDKIRNDIKVIERWIKEKNKDKYREMEERCKNRKKE